MKSMEVPLNYKMSGTCSLLFVVMSGAPGGLGNTGPASLWVSENIRQTF